MAQSRLARSRNLNLPKVRARRPSGKVRDVSRLVLGSGAERVRPPSVYRFREQLTVRGDDVGLDTLQRNLVADLEDGSPVAANAEIGVAPPLVRRFDEVAAIETEADLDELRQGRQPALVAGVEMTEHEVVDPLQPRLLRDFENASGIAAASFPTGIDQQRFAGRRDEQRRRAALDVHPVDIEIARLRIGLELQGEQHERQSEETIAHRIYRAALAVVGRGAAFFTYLFSQSSVSATTCRFDSRAA